MFKKISDKLSFKTKFIIEVIVGIIALNAGCTVASEASTQHEVVGGFIYVWTLGFIAILLYDIRKKRKQWIAEQIDMSIHPIIFGSLLCLVLKTIPTLFIIRVFYDTNLYTIPQILLDLLIYVIIVSVGFLFGKFVKIYWFVALGFCFVVSVIEYYVISFRGYCFTLRDVVNIGTAMEFKDNYSVTFGIYEILFLLQMAALCFIMAKVKLKPLSLKFRLGALVLIPIMCILFHVLAEVHYNSMKSSYDGMNFGKEIMYLKTDVESRQIIAHKNLYPGLALKLYYDAKYNVVEEPMNYDSNIAETILTDDVPEYNDNPLVISVLCESWSDLYRMVDIEAENDYMKWWREFDENCVKGYVTVSPYGASTCNSEYEFLTGNNMMFLPQHSSAFPEFVLSEQDSIIRWMDGLGFDTTSYIPNLPTDYNNSAVLQYLGIQTQYYMPYIRENGISLIPSPAHNVISDESLFINLADMIDTKLDSSKPNYVYSLTVQEHGNYDYDIENAVGFGEPYSQTAYCYTNMVNNTNNALQWLINHYKNSDRKVVIVMYGDHYPWLEGWIESNTKYDLDNLEESSRLYQTPFLIWTNQDIGYTWIDDISLNYLSNEVFKVAGIPLSPMQKWLEECRKELPIITEWGYKTADGVWHRRGEEYDADSILNKYHIIQWYRMFDENRKILQK